MGAIYALLTDTNPAERARSRVVGSYDLADQGFASRLTGKMPSGSRSRYRLNSTGTAICGEHATKSPSNVLKSFPLLKIPETELFDSP